MHFNPVFWKWNLYSYCQIDKKEKWTNYRQKDKKKPKQILDSHLDIYNGINRDRQIARYQSDRNRQIDRYQSDKR